MLFSVSHKVAVDDAIKSEDDVVAVAVIAAAAESEDPEIPQNSDPQKPENADPKKPENADPKRPENAVVIDIEKGDVSEPPLDVEEVGDSKAAEEPKEDEEPVTELAMNPMDSILNVPSNKKRRDQSDHPDLHPVQPSYTVDNSMIRISDTMIGMAVDFGDEFESRTELIEQDEDESDLSTEPDPDHPEPAQPPKQPLHGQTAGSSSDAFQFGMYAHGASAHNVLRF